MIKTNKLIFFIASDNYDKSSKLLNTLSTDTEVSKQVCILTNIEDDIKFAKAYPMFDYLICNKPTEDKTPVEQRFNSALNFIKLNNVQDYILILDK